MKALISFWCFDGTPVLWGKLMQNDHVFTHNQYSCMTVGIYFSFQHSVKLNDVWIFCKRILLKSRDGNSIFSRRQAHLVITAVASQQRKILMCFTTHAPFPLSLTCCIWTNQILAILRQKRKQLAIDLSFWWNYFFHFSCSVWSLASQTRVIKAKAAEGPTQVLLITEKRMMEGKQNILLRQTKASVCVILKFLSDQT